MADAPGPGRPARRAEAQLSRRTALLLFCVVVVTWGTTWAVMKVIVQDAPPLWATAIRSAIATLALGALLLARGRLALPPRGDLPVVAAVAVLHMTAFAALVAFGLRLVPVGRSIVLGYTTPLFVVPGAWLFLGEAATKGRLAGVAVGLLGLLALFNPLAFDWGSRDALAGNGMVLLAAFAWAANILYVRAHRWIATPLQLLPWQALLATLILTVLAVLVDGPPRIAWNPRLVAAFLYAGIVGVALAYWAMAEVNRSLPAVTTSLGILATPAVGVLCSALAFGEPVTGSLLFAMVLIGAGIVLGTVPLGRCLAAAGRRSPAAHPGPGLHVDPPEPSPSRGPAGGRPRTE